MPSARKILVFVGLLVIIGIYSGLRPAPAQAQGTNLACDAAGAINGVQVGKDCQQFLDAINRMFQAQTDGPWYNQNPAQFAKKVSQAPADEIFGERYTYAQINWIINSIATMLNPAANISNPGQLFDFINTVKSLLGEVQNGQQPTMAEYSKIGPVGMFAGGLSALYSNPPASAIGETKEMASQLFDLGTGTQPAYAQGVGWNGLNAGGAVTTLWTASRNMAYLIMVILLVAAGFLIMFRVKINPQTVVSLQVMIPKLIITMILVTFSFAIAGLVIDLIYVFIGMFVGLLSLGGLLDNATVTLRALVAGNFLAYAIPQAIVSIIITLGLGTVLLIIGLAWFPSAIIGIVLMVLVLGFWLINLIKIFWMMLKAYVMLILQICIGPLQIMLDLIPGQQGFGPWIRNIIANASVFVVVPVMLIIQHILSWDPLVNNLFGLKSIGLTATGGIGGADLSLPLFGSALQDWNFIVRWGIGFVIFAITPKVADMIRDALKIPAFKYGAAFGEALAPIVKPVGGYIANRGTVMVKNPRPGKETSDVFVGTVGETVGQTISGFSNTR